MPNTFRFNSKIVLIMFAVFILLVGIIFFYYTIGLSGFSKENARAIHSDILQGLSGLGSVAIAVIIFRIQSLENRNHSLEQATLNYISQTLSWSYPEWTSSVEDEIRNRTLTNRYYATLPSKTDKFVMEERDRQQKRLEEALNLHNRIKQTINRIRNDVILCAVFLITPLLLSLILSLVSDLLDILWTFVSVSIVVLMSALGIILLIKMVLESAVREP